MLTDKEKERLEFARRLREFSDDSESYLRSKLSRSYYSIYHAADVLCGQVNHFNIGKKVSELGLEDLSGTTVSRIKQLRSSADYDPHWVSRSFGDLDSFRQDVRERLDDGSRLFRLIELEILKRKGS